MAQTIELASGALQVRIEGSGPPIVFVHGALVNGSLWDDVVARLRSTRRCIVPEMPLGSHALPLPPVADRTPRGQARRLAELLEALDLRDVTLVGNDSGGAICQLLVATAPERVGRLVLTNCDAFETFPPPAFAWLGLLPRLPKVHAVIAHLLVRLPILARFRYAYGGLSRRRISAEQLRAWLEPGRSPAIRADVAGFVAGAGPQVLPKVVPALRRFDRPVLIAWGADDPFFLPSLAERLAETFPRAIHRPIHGASTFVALDAPEALAAEIDRWWSASGEAAA